MIGSLHVVSAASHPLAFAALVSSLAGVFPVIAALVAFTYYCLQIYESKTMANWRAERRRQKVERLQEKIKELEQEQEEEQ